MLDASTLLKYYKREDIQNEIVNSCRDKEVAVRYGEGFGKRPDVLSYPKDVIELVKQGATSFHVSEEHWRNVLQLNPNLRKNELDEMRTGWDLVLDIDCHVLEYSRIAAELVVAALQYNGIKSVSCKFSGNKGFHIAVPYEAFPKRIGTIETSTLFPEAARRIALYLKDVIKEPLAGKIIEAEKGEFANIIKKTGMNAKEITTGTAASGRTITLNTEKFLDIDTVLISSRHLYRTVYSLNEKSGLASIPLKLNQIMSFSTECAKPQNVVVEHSFLDRRKAETGEAKSLFTQAFDFKPQLAMEEKKVQKEYKEPENKIGEMYFPPCISGILRGLDDGKKRSVFILLNFLTSCGWKYDEIQELLTEWNKKNKEPLRQQMILAPLRYHQQHKKRILPPNCTTTYYKDIGVCRPDNLCARIRNPVNYTLRKSTQPEPVRVKKKVEAKPEAQS